MQVVGGRAGRVEEGVLVSKCETVRRMQVIGGVKEGGLVSKWEADGGDWREGRRRAF